MEYNGQEQTNSKYSIIYKINGEKVDSLPDGITATVTASIDGEEVDDIAAKGTDAGEYYTTVKVVLSGEAKDYTIVTSSATGDIELIINAKDVTVTADDKSKLFGEKDPELTATETGLIGKDTLKEYYTLSRETGEEVGTYAIKFNVNVPDISDFSLKDAVRAAEITAKAESGDAVRIGNYSVKFAEGTFEIKAQTPVIPDPSTPDNGGGDKSGVSASDKDNGASEGTDTGDNFMFVYWMILMIVSLAGAAGAVFRTRRNRG